MLPHNSGSAAAESSVLTQAIPPALTSAIGEVSVEEFRVEDFRFERDLRLGRQVLFLLSSTEWTRRTTEQLEISRVRSVDTEVVVDVDLSYAVHSGLRPDGDRIWLPLFTVPVAEPVRPPVRPHRRRSEVATDSDPMTSLEVTDAAGARVPKVPQSEVQHWIAAALAELLVKRLPRDPADANVVGRDELLLLTAAIRRMLLDQAPIGPLPGRSGGGGRPDDGDPATASWLDNTLARAGERIGAARTALLHAVRTDLQRARPALHSRLGDMIAAVLRTTFVVIGVDRSAGPTSFAVRMPARRLHRSRSLRWWQTPRARLRIDLLTASANTDRLIRLTLPEGVGYLPRQESERRPPPARIEVQEPRPFGELRGLVAEVLSGPRPAGPRERVDGGEDDGRRAGPDEASRGADEASRGADDGWPGPALTRSRQRLARMGAEQIDACLAVLAQYRVPVDDGPAGEESEDGRATQVAWKLRLLQECFRAVANADRHPVPAPAGADQAVPADAADHPVPAADRPSGAQALRLLREVWDGGGWLPHKLERRVLVNTDTPGVVHLRTTAAEGSVMRASPTAAMLDLEVAVVESTVLDTVRDTSLITMGLLAVVTALTLINTGGLGNLDAQTLATVLVLFPAIQAGRIERPDRGSLRGLLNQSTYLLSLATVFPPVVLAASLALREGGPDPRIQALSALAAQGLLHLVLRRRPPQWLPLRASPAALQLETDHSPELARLDRLRGRSCRSLIAEALLLGREAHAYVARDPEHPGALEHLLRDLDTERGAVARRGDGGGLLGLIRSGVGGQALTFVVHGQQVRRLGTGPWASWPMVPGAQLRPVPFASARLAPLESPAWIVEVLVGLPRGTLRRLPLPLHPVSRLARVCRDDGFPILLVQHPSPPPAYGAPGLEWLRVRVGVPYVPGEDLAGLHRLFEVVDGLREGRPDRPPCAVHVYVTRELATYEAPETAADEAARRGGSGPGAGPVAGGTRLAAAIDVIGDDPGPVLPLALCVGARVGLVGDLLEVVTARRPQVRLAGVTIALLHGLAVTFLYCTSAEPDPRAAGADSLTPGSDPRAPGSDPSVPGPAPAHPAIGLGEVIRAELEGSDEVQVAVEATGPVRPGTRGGDDDHAVPLTGSPGPPDAGQRPAQRYGPLLRLQLRTPDRAGVVPSTLDRVASVVRSGPGTGGRARDGAGRAGDGGPVAKAGLDAWFALLRVVDGRTLQGRLGIWLPPGDWSEVDWSSVTEDEQRFLPPGRDGGPPLVEDDPLLTVTLTRVPDRPPN